MQPLYEFEWICLNIKQYWQIKEFSIFGNCDHFGWRTGLLDIIMKVDLLKTMPMQYFMFDEEFLSRWFVCYFFFQNKVTKCNIHYRHKSAEINISQKKRKYSNDVEMLHDADLKLLNVWMIRSADFDLLNVWMIWSVIVKIIAIC